MRTRFKPTPEQRSALKAQLARVQQPAPALAILRPMLSSEFQLADVDVSVASVHPDRFVVRVEVRSTSARIRTFALKAYSDDFVHQVWTYSRAVAQVHRPNHRGLCLPIRYVPDERMLVSSWVHGEVLSDILDQRKPDLLRQAALLAADVHRLPLVPERPTTAQMFVDDTLARCERLRARWPTARSLVEPLMLGLQRAASCLESAEFAPVHGDLSPGQVLWTGKRLFLLDLDMFGYADPAYDIGHFLAQVERRAVVDMTVRRLTRSWLACFEETYLAAMPHVSVRNIAFYRGLTLLRKMYTLCRRAPTEWQGPVAHLAARASEAFEEVVLAVERAR